MSESHRVAEYLLLIEAEMRQQKWWTDEKPSEEALASPEPFCVDTLAFEHWLQCIFLPRMKVLLESGAALPTTSGIRPMAEVAFRETPLQAKRLIELLGEMDRVLSSKK